MDQSLDQVVKSRNIRFNGKFAGVQQKRFNNQNRNMQQMSGKMFSGNQRQQNFYQQRPRGNFQGMKMTQFRRPGFGGNMFQRQRNQGMTVRRNFPMQNRRQFVVGFQQRSQGFNQVSQFGFRRPQQNFRNMQQNMPMMRSFNNPTRNQMQFRPQQQMMQQQNTTQPTKLYISNLDFGVTNQDIKELFAEFGPMVRYGVNFSSGGRSVGTAEVVFKNRISAVKAMQKYNGVTLDGRPMRLDVQHQQTQNPTMQQQPRQQMQMQQKQPAQFRTQLNPQQRLTPMKKTMMRKPMGMMRNKPFMKRPNNKVIAAAAIRKAKTTLMMASMQKKMGGFKGNKNNMQFKGKNATPDVNQLDADLEAYANSKD